MEVKEEIVDNVEIEFECFWDYHEVKEEGNEPKTEEKSTLEVSDEKGHQVAIIKEEQTLFNELGESNCDFLACEGKMVDLLEKSSNIGLKYNTSFTEEHSSSQIQIHTEENLLYCGECNKSFIHKADLEKHSLMHTVKKHPTKHTRAQNCEKPIFGDKGKKNFTEKQQLHMQTHSVKRLFECAQCKKCFIQKGSLNVHMRTHTGEKPFHCGLCKKRFTQKNDVLIHLRTHTGEKPFCCDVCKMRFSQKQHLKRHMQTHFGEKLIREKPFCCGVCKKNFAKKWYLNAHMRTHTGERPFICDVCSKFFIEKHTLNIHMRTHTGERPFLCDLCKKSFIRKQHLKEHMRTHTGEKPFHCSVCKRNYSSKRLLIKHLLGHTGENPV